MASEDQNEEEEEESMDSNIVHHNQPVVMTVYRDHVTQNQRVGILITLPGGAEDVEFSLLGSGPGSSTARLTYSWPRISYDIDSFFEKDINRKEMFPSDPLISSFKQELQNHRETVDCIPKGVIDLTLPIPVQTVSESISKRGKKRDDGSCVMVVVLSAFENYYTVKKEEKRVSFEYM